MTKSMKWLQAKAPGFNRLAKDEQAAITDFALLWSLFESRVLDTEGNVKAICGAVEAWRRPGGSMLTPSTPNSATSGGATTPMATSAITSTICI